MGEKIMLQCTQFYCIAKFVATKEFNILNFTHLSWCTIFTKSMHPISLQPYV